MKSFFIFLLSTLLVFSANAAEKRTVRGEFGINLYLRAAAKFSTHGVACVDQLYILPTAEDITKLVKFYEKRKEFVTFVPEGWDCDDFAREFKHYASVWSRNFYASPRAAVAVGIVWAELDGDLSDLFPGNHKLQFAYHATAVILRDDGQWLWFEPQTGSLTPVESMLFEGTVTVFRIEL